MYSALNAFTPQDVMQFFEENGLKLRTERGNRVFPDSDKSSDVIKILEKTMQRYGVEGELNAGAIFLASKEASYVTGVILPIDGGYTAV
jgi:predicted flavoprotein YhiN